jgi:ribonuclease D
MNKEDSNGCVFVFDLQQSEDDALGFLPVLFETLMTSRHIVKIFHDCRLDVCIKIVFFI